MTLGRASMTMLLLFVGCGRDTAPPATGTIEATETNLGAEFSAKISELRVHEGDRVAAGDTVATLSATTLPADLARQEATVQDATAQLADLRAGARSEEIARSEAEVRRAEAEAELAETTRRRVVPLATSGVIAAQLGDEARAAAAQTAARLAAARDALRLLKAGPRPDAVNAAGARLRQARAALDAVHARERDLVLVTPVAGQVRSIWFERGELVPTGRSVLTISDAQHPWVRVYVGQALFARLTPGIAALATLDVGGQTINGRVVALSDQAEFTPRVALTEEERADLTFWVKVALSDSSGRAKAGLPVTVRFVFPDSLKH